MTRYERNQKRNVLKKLTVALFIFIVPLAAVVISMFAMNIYNKGNEIEASIDGLPLKELATFKYNYEIGSKSLYRIELNSEDNFEEAEAYIKSIKAKKINGFIVKENGYKVIYGVFTNREEAGTVQNSIASKAKSSIAETRLPSYSLKYNDKDSAFMQLVRAADKLIWEVMEARSLISCKIAIKEKYDTAPMLEEISKIEVKLEKYLGYAQKIDVSKEQKIFRDSFVILLEEILAYEFDEDKDYYKIQGGLLNQLEVYKRFLERLST